MRTLLPSLPTALLALGLGSAPAVAQAPDLPTLAVLDLEDGGSLGPDAQNLSTLGKGLAAMLTTEMMRNPRVEMVERDRVRALIDEQKLAIGGMVDPQTAVQIGKLIGARYMLFGSYADVYSTLRVDVRVVEVETGRVRRAQEVTDKRENLFKSVQTLSSRLFKELELTSRETAPPAAPIPARAALFFSQGLGYEDTGETEQAKAMYRKALEAHPEYAEARKRLEKLGGGR